MPAHPPRNAGDETARYHALDALRAAAMSLGIVLHAAVAYMREPVPGLLWPVHEPGTTGFFDWVFWWIHGFRIPLFFVVAGFFSAMLITRRGAGGFLQHRTRRILVPYLLAALVILPAIYYAWAWGWLRTDRCTVREVQRWQFNDPIIQANFRGPAHLWFLQDLYVFCLIAWLFAIVGVRWFRSPGFDRFCNLWRSPVSALLFALPTFALLWLDPGIVYEFKNSFLPRPMHLVYSLWFYVTGLALYRARRHLPRMRRGAPLWLLASLGMFVLAIRWQDAPDDEAWTRGGLALVSALFTWCSIVGWLGVFLCWLDGHRPVARYLSDASYWIYLVHLPLVGLGHVVVSDIDWPPWMRFGVVLSGSAVICLLTYAMLVRYTFIGLMLNGPRRRRTVESAGCGPGAAAPEAGSQGTTE